MTDIRKTGQLLREVFSSDPKYLNDDYLDWLYHKAPSGVVVEANRDDEMGRIGHYAVVPQRWMLSGVEQVVALSLNTAVSERARGMGMFTLLATETYAKAADRGVHWIVGVANENSTPGFTRKLGFDLKGPLEARAIVGISLRRPKSVSAKDAIVLGDFLAVGKYEGQRGEFERVWSVEELQWRLANPSANYWLILVGNCLIVATRSRHMGIPVGVILKVFVSGVKATVSLSRIGRTVSRAVKAPLSVYGGVNKRVEIEGLRIPSKLRPSPLNLILKGLFDSTEQTPMPSVMEFLDFDAY